MQQLSLRLRVFLFFCLIALGGIAIVMGAVWLGYRQSGDPESLSAFISVAVVAGFGLLGLVVFVWLLFDTHVSKAIEHLAAQFRVRADAGVAADIDPERAKFLGDLGPAAHAIAQELVRVSGDNAQTIAAATTRLRNQRDQLLGILSDMPVAVIVASKEHQIVLYDGQAAEVMEQEAPARLSGSIFDYLDETQLRARLAEMESDGVSRRHVTLNSRSGLAYTGYLRILPDRAGYTLMLDPLDPDVARPMVHDFDLLGRDAPCDIQTTDLLDLQFVVFDSETTGLDPERDDVVQLGAVRVVNGKIVRAECFETLVNPGRPIPAQSTKVHGVSDTMVADAPDFASIRAAFHGFAKDGVLVAHNAPFDMAFLNRDCAKDDLRFDHPVMDTVHLSAIIFGGSATHTLDALCERLRIQIPDAVRHTALGDAIATAEALVHMLPILKSRGFHTFEQVRQEALKHRRILELAPQG